MPKKVRRKKALKTLRNKHNPQNKKTIKISEAILVLSESLRKQYGESHRVQVIISITAIAWNISLYPEEEQEHVRKILTDNLQKANESTDTEVLLNCIDTLIEQKKTLYPHVNEYIVNYDLSFSGTQVSLSIRSSPIEGKI